MNQADRIRLFVYENHIVPARQAGRAAIEIRAGDIHATMDLINAMPAVCSALRSTKFERLAAVTTISITGPQFGSNVFFTFGLAGHAPVAAPRIAPPARTANGKHAPEAVHYTDAVLLVSCVGSKLQQPAPARLLYQSDWFIKARSFAEAQPGPWFILSALYGVVAPDEMIAPYERTLNTLRVDARRTWATRVHDRLPLLLAGRRRIVFLAGQRYREFLVPRLVQDGFQVEIPMEGLRIGEQLSWLSAQL